jgi:hypothetical protein
LKNLLLDCFLILTSKFPQDDTLIASWEEDSPSNWTILSGYIRFTLRGDCSGGTVSVELNGQQIAQVSGILQHVETITHPSTYPSFLFSLSFSNNPN